MIKNIFITGARMPACLHIARQFGRKKYNVFVGDCDSLAVTRYSKYTKFRKFKSPLKDEKSFIEDIIKICKSDKIEVLLPVYEEGFYISKYETLIKKELPNLKIISVKYELLSKLHHKFELEKLLEKHDINFVKSYEIMSYDDLSKYLKKGKKYVLKPDVSRFASFLKYVNYKDLKSLSLNLNFDEKYILQDYIDGEHFCLYAYVNEGKVLTLGIYPQQFTTQNVGTCLNFKNVKNKLIENLVREFVKKLNFSGQLGLDVIISKDDGKPYIIDANPRLTSGVHLFSDKDNLTDTILYNLITKPTNGDSAIFLGLISFGIKNLFHKNLRDEYLKVIDNSKDVIFAKDDFFPFFGQIIYYILLFFKSIFKRKQIRELLLLDLNFEFKDK